MSINRSQFGTPRGRLAVHDNGLAELPVEFRTVMSGNEDVVGRRVKPLSLGAIDCADVIAAG